MHVFPSYSGLANTCQHTAPVITQELSDIIETWSDGDTDMKLKTSELKKQGIYETLENAVKQSRYSGLIYRYEYRGFNERYDCVNAWTDDVSVLEMIENLKPGAIHNNTTMSNLGLDGCILRLNAKEVHALDISKHSLTPQEREVLMAPCVLEKVGQEGPFVDVAVKKWL
jgi:hypothetical protein